MTLRFSDPWPVALGVLAGAILIVLVVLTYRSLREATDRRSRLTFLALRISAVVLLFLLVLEPVLSRDRLKTEDLDVVVLLDRSRSMSIPDSYRGMPRFRVATEFLDRAETGLVRLLEDDFTIRTLAFDTEVRAAGAKDLDGATPPWGRMTDIAAAIRAAGIRAAEDRGSEAGLAAVVLLSDGADNGGGDPVAAAEALGAPLYAVGFGSRSGETAGRRDLAILSVDAPETAFAENTVLAEASVRSTGYSLDDPGNRKVRVVLEKGGEEVASASAEFTEEGAPVRVPLRFVPGGKGAHTFKVRIAVRGDEAIAENNTRTFTVEVADRRASVLFFDAVMRWEAKFLRDFLARDPAVDLTSVQHSGQGRLLVKGDTHGADLSRGLPLSADGFAKFDVVVLGDVKAAALTTAQLDLLRKRVEEGGGLLTLGGYRAYGAGGYTGTPLEEALPVFLGGDLGQREEDLRVRITPEGRIHPSLSGLGSWFAGSDAPTLRGLSLVKREKPGAQVLLEGDGGEIVLAAHRYGEGRAAAFTGDTSWVWFRDPDLGGKDGLHPRFWGQIVRWLLEKEPEMESVGEALVVFTDRASYRIGETVRIRARVRDPEGRPVADATLTAAMVAEGNSRPLELMPVKRVPGHYEARVRASAPGSYFVTAKARRSGAELGRAEATFIIEDASVEMDRVDLDNALLSAVARASGGRYYHAPPTAEAVARDIRGALVGMTEREELSLSNTPLFFLLFTALLTIEWYLRRRRNLL